MKIFGNKSAVSCWCIICSRCCLLALVEPPKSQWFIIFQMNTARLPGLASSHHLWWWLETWSSSPRILGCFGTRHDRFLTILGSTPWKSQEHVCVYIHMYIYMYRGFLSQQIPDSNSQIGEFAILNWTAPMALGPFGQHFPVNAKAHAVDFDCGPPRVDLEIALDLYVYMYIYIYILYVYIYIYVWYYIYIQIIHIYIYIYIYVWYYIYIHKLFTFTYIYIQYIYIYLDIYIHSYSCVHTHKHRHACIFLLWICRCTWASP